MAAGPLHASGRVEFRKEANQHGLSLPSTESDGKRIVGMGFRQGGAEANRHIRL